MSKRPQFTANRVLRAVERDGWQVVRKRGLHRILRHPTKPGRVVIPMHTGTLPLGTVESILEQAGLTVEELEGLL